MVSSVSPETEHTPAKVLTVSRESPPATAVRPDNESTRHHVQHRTRRRRGRRQRDRRTWLRRPWEATWPGRATYRTSTDWRPPRGLRGLTGLRADAPSHTSATRRRRCGGRRRVRRARAGFEIDHSEPSGSRVAISRAAGPDGARNTSGATSNTAPGTATPGLKDKKSWWRVSPSCFGGGLCGGGRARRWRRPIWG